MDVLTSCLGNRQQHVKCSGFLSDMEPISKRVPQGNIWGPFLFNLYANDIVNIAGNVKYVNCVDYAKLFFFWK